MAELSEKGLGILSDLPEYEQDDPTIQALADAVAREMQRIEDHLVELRSATLPDSAEGVWLGYWEDFMGLPTNETIATDRRIAIIKAAIGRRAVGAGAGWRSLLEAVLDDAAWQHTENSDENGAEAEYELQLGSIRVEATSYMGGIFEQMARDTTPAHLKISEIELAGADTFRSGESEVGDEI